MKPFLWVILAILSMPIAFADWQDYQLCTVGTPCSIQRLVVNNSAVNISTASCNITIRNTTNILIDAAIMNVVSAGYYNYTFTPNQTGTYPSQMYCVDGTDAAISDVSFVAERGVSRFMGFELAIPFFMLALSGLCCYLWLHQSKQAKKGLGSIAYKHALIAFMTLFIYVGIAVLRHIAAFESTGNVELAGISTIMETLFSASTWILVFVYGIILTTFIISSVLWIRESAKVQKEKEERENNTFEVL